MKRLLFLFILLAAAIGFSFLCSFAWIEWDLIAYICAIILLFITGTTAFVLFFRWKKFSIKKAILFSSIGGFAYIGLHLGLSHVAGNLISHKAFPILTALFTAVYSILVFLILILLSLDDKDGQVYQDVVPPSDLAELSEEQVTNRLYSSRWGVFIHYLCGVQNNPGHPSNMGVGMTDWSSCVNDLDVNLLARQLHESGAHFLYITIMQGSRHMIAPNKTYDDITGMKPGEACAKRDLVLDLYNALEPYGIDLYLYTTGDGPHADPVCGPKMGYVKGHVKKTFVNNWASVLREYAVRYGDKVKGWWIDGCYRAAFGYTDKLMKPYYDAIKKGNPKAVVAFNNGVANYYKKNYCNEDYVCGEFNYFNVLPRSRFVDGAQTFLLAPLGSAKYTEGADPASDWACPGTRYSGEYMHNFVSCCNAAGGVVAIDIGLKRDGSLYPEQLAVLKQIEI